MPKAARLGDVGAGHGCFPSSNATSGSPDVSINGKPAVRVSDTYASHGCGVCAPHGRALAAGSATVSMNGLASGRIGDAIDCGGVAATGSPNVFIGDVGIVLPAWVCQKKMKEAVTALMFAVPPEEQGNQLGNQSGKPSSGEQPCLQKAASQGTALVQK